MIFILLAFISEAFEINSQQKPIFLTLLFSEPRQESLSSRSIGDVVQGLHGNKYQFNDAGINRDGQNFAEMGYGSTPLEEENYSDEPLPQWALKLQNIVPDDDCMELNFTAGSTKIRIQNQERSWEKYYAFIVGESVGSLAVEPSVGMLAPRGGTNDFLDSTELILNGNIKGKDAWLVSGTETEKWIYRIV